MAMTIWQRAFVRGGVVAAVIGTVVLSAPVLVSLARPGPIDSRIYTNLVLIPVFVIVIFAFGGFIGLLRALSQDQQARRRAAAAARQSPERTNPGEPSR
jgi:hypothetical protein